VSTALEVVTKWRSLGVAQVALSSREVASVEDQLQVKFPWSLSELLLNANGMKPNTADEQQFRFFSIAEIRLVVSELPEADWNLHRDYYVFAEFSLWSHGYAVRLDDTRAMDSVVLVGGPLPILIARSFSEFLALYLSNSNLLFGS
jgi:SMI1 / KNR4 family (SUKH-1)